MMTLRRRGISRSIPATIGLAVVLVVTGMASTACGLAGSGGGKTGAAGQTAQTTTSATPSTEAPTGSPTSPSRQASRPASARCSSVKVIGARGTGEQVGLGYLLKQVARQIDAAVSKPVKAVGLDYPATTDFQRSAQQGTTTLKRMIAANTSACLVLLGYSQGAIVVGDAVAAVGATRGKRIIAIILFGDPRFNSAEPYNVGTFAKGSRGVYPRPKGQLSAFNSRIQDYCNGGDTVCQGPGANGSGGHGDYLRYADDAGRFVARKVRALS